MGRALRDSGLAREDGFITTKFHPRRMVAEAEAQRSLQRLGRSTRCSSARSSTGAACSTRARSDRWRSRPTATHQGRIEENAEIFDFTLSDQDMTALDALDRTAGTDGARERKWW